jgi:hypothetical protein
VHGIDGARQQHRLGADLEYLHDVRGILLPVGGDGGRQRLRIGALPQRLDLVLALAVVELLGLGLQRLAELAGQRMPEVDLGLRLGGGRQRQHGQGAEERDQRE